jgi:hypothetical protein
MAKGPQRFLDAAGHAIRKVTVWTSGDEVDVATSPVILSGSGVPGAVVPNGSIYLRTNGDAYIRTGDAWVTTELAPGDFGAGPLLVDVIDESTGAAGVTVDGLLIKDERLQPTGAGISSGDAGVTLKDNLANAWDFKEAGNSYLIFATTNDAERAVWGKLQACPVQTIDMADAAVALVYGTAGAGEVKITGQALLVDANSAGTEDLTLPPVATSTGVSLDIYNTGGESIVVKDVAAATILTIATGKAGRVVCDGSNWFGLLGA